MRKLWIGLAGVLVLLAVADFVVKEIVERRVADAVASRYELTSRPEIDIKGFPFLLQAATRELDDVDVGVGEVTVSGVDLQRAEIAMHDVRLSSARSGVAEQVEGNAVIPYGQLTELANRAGATGISVAYGGEADLVGVSATVQVLGREIDVVARGQVRVSGSRLTVRTTGVEVDGQPAADAIVRAVGDRLDLTIRIPSLFGMVRLDWVQVTPAGVQVGLAGSNIPFG